MLKKGLFFLVVLIMSQASYGQMSKKEAKAKMKKADGLFRQSRYGDALNYYKELNEYAPKEEEYVYRIGICEIHIDGQQEHGLDYLLSVRKRSDYPEYDFYLAQAYYYNYNFPEAIKLYKQFSKTVDDENYHLKQYVQLMMSYCINAYEIMQDTMNAKIINLGEPLNTIYHEYTPSVTPEESMMVFTYRGSRSKGGLLNPKLKPTVKNGRYYEDVFTSYRGKDGKWVKPYPIDSINTLGNDASVALSPTGDKLVIYKSSSSNPGDLYVSYFKDSTWTVPEAFRGDVNSPDWEGSAAFTTDGTKLYFSSERLGGYGGKDIYVAEIQKDGSWANVHNLGPEINSEHDEDAPYVHPDQKTLYFSSNGTRSMGSYDIFYATLTPDNKWKNVVNAGYPINSLDDDRYYVLSADGQTGYFSRESTTGNRDQDLYIITPGKVGDPPVLALITGSVFLDGGNQQGEIYVYDIETGELEGKFSANPNTEEFTMILTPGKKYSIKVKVDGKEMYHEELDAQDLNKFMRLEHDYHVYSDDYEGEKVQMKLALQEKFTRTLTETGEIKVDTTIVFGATTIITEKDTLVMSDLNDIVKKNKQEFYKEHKDLAEKDHVTDEQLVEGHVEEDEAHHDGKGYEPSVFHPVFSAADTVYRIQVAAYRKPENYKWKGEDHYGDVLEVTYEDGITRFTIGGTKYLSEAESLRKMLMEFGVEDAFIVAFKGSERIPLYELIKLQKQ